MSEYRRVSDFFHQQAEQVAAMVSGLEDKPRYHTLCDEVLLTAREWTNHTCIKSTLTAKESAAKLALARDEYPNLTVI